MNQTVFLIPHYTIYLINGIYILTYLSRCVRHFYIKDVFTFPGMRLIILVVLLGTLSKSQVQELQAVHRHYNANKVPIIVQNNFKNVTNGTLVRTQRALLDSEDLFSHFFNAFGEAFLNSIPYGHLVMTFLTLFKSITKKNEPSLYDKIMREIDIKIMKGVTDYHEDTVRAKLLYFKERGERIVMYILPNEHDRFEEEMVRLREDMFDEKHYFFPEFFHNSTSYNPRVIASMAPFAGLYLSISVDLEEYLEGNPIKNAGKLKTLMAERHHFFTVVKNAASKTLPWALQKRVEQIDSNVDHAHDRLTGMKQYTNKFWVWTKFGHWKEVITGPYHIMAHKVQEITKDVIFTNIFKPINVLLALTSVPLLETTYNHFILYDLTIYGELCDSTCTKGEDGYWVCRKNGYSEYCSQQGKTYRGDNCTSSCQGDGSGYFWCHKSGSSWDYCSPSNKIVQHWPKHSRSLTEHNILCKSDCTNEGTNYYWCPTYSWNWNFCSPNNKTFTGESCTTGCDLPDYSSNIDFKHVVNFKCYIKEETTPEKCFQSYQNNIKPMPQNKECIETCSKNGTCHNDHGSLMKCTSVRPNPKDPSCKNSCSDMLGYSDCVSDKGWSLCIPADYEPGEIIRKDDYWYFINTLLITDYNRDQEKFLSNLEIWKYYDKPFWKSLE